MCGERPSENPAFLFFVPLPSEPLYHRRTIHQSDLPPITVNNGTDVQDYQIDGGTGHLPSVAEGHMSDLEKRDKIVIVVFSLMTVNCGHEGPRINSSSPAQRRAAGGA